MAVVAVAFFLSVFSVSAARSRPVKESTVPVSVPRSGLRPPAPPTPASKSNLPHSLIRSVASPPISVRVKFPKYTSILPALTEAREGSLTLDASMK